jgi:hypothetical protein
VGSVCGLHVPFASPIVEIPRFKINIPRDYMSPQHLQWFERYLGE